MNKKWYQSKAIQGILVAMIGALWGVWAQETQLSSTIVIGGLGWAGYGFRDTAK